MTSQQLAISNSEMRAFAQCRRRWWLSYCQAWRLRDEFSDPTGAVNIGSQVHLALEAYYGYGLDPLAVLRWSYHDVINRHPESERQLQKDLDMASAMTEGYLEWLAETGTDSGLEIVDAEHEVTHDVTLPDGTVVTWRGKLDLLVRRMDDGRLAFRDFKPQPLTEHVLTPSGWVFMGDLQAGDHVLDHIGQAQRVQAVYDRGEDDVYKISFNDGSAVRATADHPWLAAPYNGAVLRVMTTAELTRGSVLSKFSPREDDHDISLPLEPYLLGAWLANGDRSGNGVSDGEPATLTALDTGPVTRDTRPGHQNTYYVRLPACIRESLRSLGLLGRYSKERFIPPLYFTASYKQRLALFHGLMDGDGAFNPKARKTASYSTVSQNLAEDVANLTRSLGGWAKVWVRPVPNYTGTVTKGVVIRTSFNPFLHVKHAFAWDKLRNDNATARAAGAMSASGKRRLRGWPEERKIVQSVEYDGREPVRCIQVDSPDHLYVTTSYTVTHNTVGSFEKANALLLDPQMRFYVMLQALMHPVRSQRVDGALFMMMKRSKRTQRATGPFYQQAEVSYNTHDLNATWLRALSVTIEIVSARRRLSGEVTGKHAADHHFTVYPNPGDYCAWGCPFYSVCHLLDDGSRWEDAVSARFEHGDPYRYYSTERIIQVLTAFGER